MSINSLSDSTRSYPCMSERQPVGHAHRPVCKEQDVRINQAFTLKKQYLEQIIDGRKTVEGRINAGAFRNIHKGDVIKFFCTSFGRPLEAICRITHVHEYRSFRSMIEKEGIQNILPGITSVEEGIRAYESIPSYKERALRSGVVALQLELLSATGLK